MPTVVQQALANQQAPTVALLTPAAGVTGTSAGTWFPLNGVYPFSVTVTGVFSATLKLLVSNSVTTPADSDTNAPQLDTSITAVYAGSFTAPYRWIKCQVSAYTSGTPVCSLMAG